MARPRKPFNWDIVEALISLKASERYIAEYLLKKEGHAPNEIDSRMVSRNIKLLQRRIKERWGTSFVQFRDQKQEDWRIELIQLQRKSAKDGKIAMQIWLGKQDLGQHDKMDIHETFEPLVLNMPISGQSVTVTKKGLEHGSNQSPAANQLPPVPALLPEPA
jgi:hypothetical protein